VAHDKGQERAGWQLAAAMLAVIVFGYLMPATGYFTAVPGNIGDTRYNSVVLEHLYRVVVGQAELWSPGFFYPFQGVLAFSDTHFGSGATYVLARLLGLSREHAYDAWFVAGTLLNFASALYVLRRLGLSTAAAALGAFFFSFALPVPAKDVNAQLVHRFAAPLAVLALWQMFERRRLADLSRVAFFTVWQFYCSIYLGLFLVYLLAALSVAILVIRKPFQWRQWRANLAVEHLTAKLAASGVLLVSTLAFAYLVGQHLLISRAYNLEGWSVEYITLNLPRLESYLIADASPWLSWFTADIYVPMRHEQNLFIGFGAIVLIVAAVAWRGSAGVTGLTEAMAIALALLFAGTLLVGHVSFYHLVAWLPGIKAIRAVSRIIFVMLIPMSVLVGLGADAVWRRLGQGIRRMPVLAGLAALVIAEPLSVNTASVPIAEWRSRVDSVRALLPPSVPKDAILFVRSGSANEYEQYWAELDAMLLGQDLGYPVLNGVSAFYPPGYRFRRCVPASERLEGYSNFAGGIDVSTYARRLVVLDLDAECPPAAR
jgi:hypothetical protein